MLGLSEVGIELDPAACATRTAAGHQAIRADVAAFPLGHLAGRVEGLAMSPPCTTFSAAGKGEGRVQLARLVEAAHAGAWHAVDPSRAAGYGHVLEVGRWAETARPEWVVCEQVPEVLPVWRAYADRWRVAGWSTWAGVLNSADFGVPQTRKRAFLIASRVRPVGPPAPTHARSPEQSLFGPALEPWVSMADALGWAGDNVDRPARALCGHRSPRWLYPDRDGTRGAIVQLTERQGRGASRSADQPAMTITASAGNGNFRWVREQPATALNRRQNSRTPDGGSEPVRLVPVDEPAPTLTGVAGAKGQWVWERPATTIVGDGRAFGPHAGSAGEPQSHNAIRLTEAEALCLQGFRPDFPVQGTKTKRFRQVGDAVPPLLAAHVAAAATGRTITLEEAAA